MPWITGTLMSQRLNFVQDVLSNVDSVTNLCLKYDISRTLGYRYLKRFKEEGYRGLADRTSKPKYCPHQTSLEIEKLILDMRKQYPEWGARKLLTLLKKENPSLHFPAVSSITALLRRNQLIDKEESLKRQPLIRFEREHPNELWQMDFKGFFTMLNKSRCYPLTILDDCSRFSLGINALGNETGQSVISCLTLIFKQFGLPEQINVDNGNPWGNSRGAKHTYVTVWLLRLGIQVTHSRPHHPQTNGKIERFHRTLKKECLKNEKFQDLLHAQNRLDTWREIYNNIRPHEALQMKTPSEYYTPSNTPFPDKLPNIEYDTREEIRKVRGNGHISFANKSFCIGEAFKNFYVSIKPSLIDGSFHIYFGKNIINTISF